MAEGSWLALGLAPLDWVAGGVAGGCITHSWVPGGGWPEAAIGQLSELVL